MAAIGGHFFRITGYRWHLGLGEPAVAQSVLLDLLEGLLAEVVLDLAGVGGGYLRADTQEGKKLGKQLVPLVDALGDLLSGGEEGDESVAGRREMSPSLSISI